MRVYFLSARPCALKINGNYLGTIDGFERFCELSPQDAPLCELQPLNGRFLPVVFALTEKITADPPDGVSLYVLPDGLAIRADKFVCADPALRLIAQENFAAGELTVFSQGFPQALLQQGGKSEIIPLNENFENCTATEHRTIILLRGRQEACALTRTGKPFFRGKTKSVRYDEETDELRLVTPLNDFCARTADFRWTCAGETPVLTGCTLSAPRETPSRFLLCVCLQNLLLGADAKELLSEDLYADLDALKAFLGAYVAVTVAPQYAFGAGAVYAKSKNVYEVRFFSADTENGKIVNVKRES